MLSLEIFSSKRKKEKKEESELPDLNWGPIGIYDKYPLQPTALPTELSSDIK